MTGKTSRRRFLGTSGAATAAGVGLFQILGNATARAESSPRSSLEAPVIGLIGCGGMGRANMAAFMGEKTPIAAVCDVDSRHAGKAADQVEENQGKRPEIYKDFRELLDRQDIDAVIIATPDHWHALPFIRACEAGKDIFCEKPISHDIIEAKTMAAAAKRHGRIVQVGTWQRSTREFVAALDLVHSGDFGRVVVARAWKTDNSRMGKNPPKDPPKELDYDFWIGPAEMVPYTDKNCHYDWRWYWNTAAGMTGDWGVHMIDIALLGLGDGGDDIPMPSEVFCQGGKLAFPDDDRTTPDTQLALLRFPGAVLQWETNRRALDGRHNNGTQFITDSGKTLTVWRGGLSLQDAEGKDLETPELPDEGLNGLGSHVQDFLECLESRRQPRSNIESMARTTIVCHLVNASYLAGQPVRWSVEKNDLADSVGKETISYQREYRKPWELPSLS